MWRRFWRSVGALAWLLAAAPATPVCAAAVAAAQEQVAAVYKAHELRFTYRSFVNLYDCSELRDHVAVILLALGARDDIRVRVDNCELFLFPDDTSDWDRSRRPGWPTDPFGAARDDRMQTSSVRVDLMFPIEATPAVLAEIDKDKSRRELISRVTGNPLAALNDPVMFPAQRREVTLSRGTIRLKPQDCELLEQMIPTLFRELDIKVVHKDLSCDSHRRAVFAPNVVVETLLPVGAAVPAEKEQKK